jgi:hypothetical protein
VPPGQNDSTNNPTLNSGERGIISTRAKVRRGRNNICKIRPKAIAFGRLAICQNCPGLREDPIVNMIRAKAKLIKKSIIIEEQGQ